MRKYDIKNKRNIGIIIVISIIIIIMFSLFIKLFLSKDKKEYQIIAGSIIFDKDKSLIKVEDNGIIKNKWNNEYYLSYNNKNIELGPSALSYNENTGEIHLYGRYYEISSGDEINITSDETIIKNSALTKFYKLSDRKYLVIDSEIKSSDGLLSTSDFLLIDLDKVGNATLTNHKISLKAFAETTIVTSNYTFDIANEILTYGSDKIDLKKIIGSSNNYTKDDLIVTDNDNNTNNGSTGITENNIVNNDTTKEESDNSKEETSNTMTIEEVKKASKRTSVIAVTSTVSKITVDYVIYDPKKEYTSVYMEVKKEGSSMVDTIYLNSSATTYELTNNIFPNTTYELAFKYSYLDENNELHVDTFDTAKITTKKPSISLKVTRTSFSRIDYLITTDNSYQINSGLLTVLVNGNITSTSEVTINGNTVNSINISNIMEDDAIELRITDIKSNGNIIKDLQASYKFKY